MKYRLSKDLPGLEKGAIFRQSPHSKQIVGNGYVFPATAIADKDFFEPVMDRKTIEEKVTEVIKGINPSTGKIPITYEVKQAINEIMELI